MSRPDETKRDPINPIDEDDDAEYELEPPDAEVIAAEERRAQQAVDATRMTIDIDEIYRDSDRRRGNEILDDWFRDFRFGFRFQTKHLLIATAVLAIVLTLWQKGLLGTTLVILLMLSVAGVYLYVSWQEKKQQQEAERRRQEMYARNRSFHEKLNRAARDNDAAVDSENDGDSAEGAAAKPASRNLRLRFSLWELLVAMTVAAIVLGVVSILGGPANTATMLGFLALFGLAIHAVGFDPPEFIILGWWLILVLYVLLSIAAVVWSSFA